MIFMAGTVSVGAYGQTSTYSNTTTATINNATNCGGGEFTRTFVVPGSDDFTINDLDVGFLASHTWRGDVQLDLASPAGTSVRLINTDTGGGSEDNYNVEMDDGSATLINTAPHDTNDGLVAPPYENSVRPNNALSAFNGENSVGTWTMTMCDAFPTADNGQFIRADLYFTQAVGADLDLGLSASNSTPSIGTNVVLTYVITNSGPVTTTGVTADVSLPSGLSYVSDDGAGAYNSGTGVWTIPGSLAGSSTITLQLTAFVNSSGSFDVVSEILTSGQVDPDSTPGNGNTGEDDYAALTLAPVTPAVPTLSCPGAPTIMDWDTEIWTTADMTNTYTVAGETIIVTVTDADNSLLSDPNFGGQTPAESIYDTGGITPGQSDLHFLRNPSNRTSTVDVVYTLGTAGVGVAKLQLSIFDVDFGNNQFVDAITVTGSLGGVPVTPTLFTSASNTATGNVVIGNNGSTPTQSLGNMTLEFNSAVDTVTISYGNDVTAPVDPGNQGISIHDLNFCPVLTAELTGQKTAEVYDPLSEGLYMVPGNDVVYTITFTNVGDGAADSDSVEIIDAIPSEIEFYNGDIDDGGPETTAVTGTDNGSGLTFNYGADVGYSNGGSAPANFAACAYTPAAGYDANVTYICVNPSGVMAAGNPDPSFAVKFRARIK
jgi:uncharacterized repeat protein (TIGR01451 family)